MIENNFNANNLNPVRQRTAVGALVATVMSYVFLLACAAIFACFWDWELIGAAMIVTVPIIPGMFLFFFHENTLTRHAYFWGLPAILLLSGGAFLLTGGPTEGKGILAIFCLWLFVFTLAGHAISSMISGVAPKS